MIRWLMLGAHVKVFAEFAWMNVYDHRFSALTLPGQGKLRNKEPEFALR